MHKEAIDMCIEHNQWQLALEIVKQMGNSMKAQKIKFSQQIEQLINKNVANLILSNRPLMAVELYKQAGMNLQAAELLHQVK